MHLTFPAQFLHLAPYLARNPENKVYFIAKGDSIKTPLEGVNLELYKFPNNFNALINSKKSLWPIETPIKNVAGGLGVLEVMERLKAEQNIQPDIIIGHIAWGALSYVKDMYPNVPVIGYFEWVSSIEASHWWSDEVATKSDRVRIRTHQAKYLANFDICDAAVTATQWQYSLFPEEYRYKSHVIHEGIDMEFCSPAPDGKRPGLVLDDIKLNLPEGTEIITYISRGFEPARGFPQFMDAMRIVLEHRPNTHVILVGKDKPAYAAQLKDTTYLKEEQKKGGYPVDRVHIVGRRGREDYQKILRASSCHVYLTRPFVLSWSCLEAMSFACPMVCSETPPVQEVMEDGVNGLLANFHSPNHIARKIEEILDDPELAKKLGNAARETIRKRFELKKCLRAWEDLMYSLIR